MTRNWTDFSGVGCLVLIGGCIAFSLWDSSEPVSVSESSQRARLESARHEGRVREIISKIVSETKAVEDWDRVFDEAMEKGKGFYTADLEEVWKSLDTILVVGEVTDLTPGREVNIMCSCGIYRISIASTAIMASHSSLILPVQRIGLMKCVKRERMARYT